MQIGGVGSGLERHGSSHQVTNCIHNHDVPQKGQSAMRLSSVTPQASVNTAEEKEVTSLADMLRGVVSVGRRFFGWIWGNEAAGSGSAIDGSGGEKVTAVSEQVMAQIGGEEQDEKTTASIVHNNPYFMPAESKPAARETVFQTVRMKIQGISKQLTKRFHGKFFGQSSLDSNKERPKEDLRKHSRYREDDLEIDCVLTDDSYLMDSYDRRGEYSTLTTETGIKKQ